MFAKNSPFAKMKYQWETVAPFALCEKAYCLHFSPVEEECRIGIFSREISEIKNAIQIPSGLENSTVDVDYIVYFHNIMLDNIASSRLAQAPLHCRYVQFEFVLNQENSKRDLIFMMQTSSKTERNKRLQYHKLWRYNICSQ